MKRPHSRLMNEEEMGSEESEYGHYRRAIEPGRLGSNSKLIELLVCRIKDLGSFSHTHKEPNIHELLPNILGRINIR